MTLDYKVRAVDVWPGEATPSWKRSRSPFKTIWTKVMKDLAREVRMLGGREVLLRLDIADKDIRQDGLLRADARPRSPGVIVEFTASRLKGSPRLLYRCDRFSFWQDNVSAIARGLEALRLVDRYGVTPTGEQYAGFKALPASTAPTMGVEQAAEVIAMESKYLASAILSDVTAAKAAVRVAIHRTHPDRNMGERTAFDKVDAARKSLASHHGVSL
jgi:hypothetical protein